MISSARPGFSAAKRASTHLGRQPSLITLSEETALDRKSTRLNSSHSQISYAVLCLTINTAMLLFTSAYLAKRLPPAHVLNALNTDTQDSAESSCFSVALIFAASTPMLSSTQITRYC